MGNRPKRKQHSGFSAAELRWTAEDAVKIRRDLVEWLRTGDGAAMFLAHLHAQCGGRWPAQIADNPRAAAAHAAATNADLVSGLELIWCDPPMVALLSAAADTYPDVPVQPVHMPAPDGMVVFSEPVAAIWADATRGEALHRLSAITWASFSDPRGMEALSVVGWVRATGPSFYRPLNLRMHHRHLRLFTSAVGNFGASQTGQGGAASPARLLQTLTALLRSPLITERREAAQGPARRQTRQPDRIRRVYLRKPEHGEAELQAARDARAGRQPRGHWVRGHWKQQWYASVEEHRTIWIEGYARGDFDLGRVPGAKVLVARSNEHDWFTKRGAQESASELTSAAAQSTPPSDRQ